MKFWRYLLLFLISISLIISSRVLAQNDDTVVIDTPLPEEIEIEQNTLNLSPTQLRFIEADQLYLTGNKTAASLIYQELKPPFPSEATADIVTLPPLHDASLLPVKASVYWRLAQQAWQQEPKLETKILAPLKLLLDEYFGFIPAQILYAQALKHFNQPQLALEVLEKAATQYDSEPDLLKLTITTLAENKQWLEASIMARQFALTYQENAQAEEFQKLAEQNLQQYQRHLRSELTGNAIANILTGTISYFVTNNPWTPLNTIQTTALLLQGESAVGQGYSNYLQQKIPLLKDEQIQSYIQNIGEKLIKFTGRNEFNYEFHLIMDEQLNAFALPGGKIFINTGALIKTNSEAEIAGLLAHELSHSVLSHSFRLMTEGNLTDNILQAIPYGNTLANLIFLNYSREMERQADILGTKILANSGYAADGLRNLTHTLYQETKDKRIPQWLSSHPTSQNRIAYLEDLIIKNGYNRYAFEGVIEHSKIQHKTAKIMAEFQEKKDS